MNMPESKQLKIAAVVLSGGKSSRMGQDKAKLKINNTCFLEHMQNLLVSANITDVFVSDANHIFDLIPNKGPLSGIHACMVGLNVKYESIIFLPVDMPALTSGIIQGLAQITGPFDYVHYDKQIMPIRIAVNDKTIKHIENILNTDANLSIRNFLKPLNGKLLPLANAYKDHFQNLNTPEEFNKFVTGQ